MSTDENLSMRDATRLAKLTRSMDPDFLPTPDSVSPLLEQWSRLVTQVEEGYALIEAEYIDALYVRERLEILLLTDPKARSDELSKHLESWDARFKVATQEIMKPLMRLSDPHEDWDFWRYRVPKKLRQSSFELERWMLFLPAPYEVVLTDE